jgi:hypothetical protein
MLLGEIKSPFLWINKHFKGAGLLFPFNSNIRFERKGRDKKQLDYNKNRKKKTK